MRKVMMLALVAAGCAPVGAQLVATSPGTVIVDRPWGATTEQQVLDMATAACRSQGARVAVLLNTRSVHSFTQDADRHTFECR